MPNENMFQNIPIELIDADPTQPRKHFDEAELQELAESIEASGLAVAVLVRPVGDRYLLVHGERRWRAVRKLGWSAIRAEVREIDDETARWLALVENVQRADLTPIEEAQAYAAVLSTGCTQTELGRRIGKGQSYIAQKLRLLRMPEPLQVYANSGMLSENHCRQLLKIEAMFVDDIRRTFDMAGLESVELITDADVWSLALLLVLRPLDEPVGAPVGDAGIGQHVPAVRAMLQYIRRHECTPPAWAIVAFWYAAASVSFGWNVSRLTEAINAWRDMFYSAVVFASPYEPPSGEAVSLGRLYAADLHRSSDFRRSEDVPRALAVRAHEHCMNACTLPSALQYEDNWVPVRNYVGDIVAAKPREG